MPDEEIPEYARYRFVQGGEAWREWPEFKALAMRLGIEMKSLPTTGVTIDFPCDGLVKVTQTYHGRDMTKPDKS